MKIDINKKYKTRAGKDVVIYTTDAKGDYPVHGAILYDNHSDVTTWRLDGVFDVRRFPSELDLVEVNPYNHINIDDKVIVWDREDYKVYAHFAGIDKRGKPTVFFRGLTSWTCKDSGDTVAYDYCEKVEG